MPNTQKYWREIDGRHLINYRVALIISPIAILSAPLQEMKQGSGTFFQWTIASTAAWAIMAVIFAGADITVFRDREERRYPLWVGILFGGILGIFKGFFTTAIAHAMNISHNGGISDLYFRTITGMFIGAMGVPIGAFLLTAVREYSEERRHLIEDYLDLESQVKENSETLTELRSNLSTKVDENLKKTLMQAQKTIKSDLRLDHQWEEIAETLRKTAEQTIRPLSHEMWNSRRKELQLSTGEFLRFVVANMQFRPLVILPLYIVTTLMSLVHENHILHPTFVMLLKVISIWILLEIANIFLEMFRARVKYLLIYILIGIAILHYPLTELIYRATDFGSSYIDLFDTGWLLVLILAAGISDSAMRAQIYQIQTLKGLVNEKRLELISKGREVDRMGREMAKYLHGTIQSKLMAAAMAVEIAGRKNDQAQLDLEIERALQTLEMPSKGYLLSQGAYVQDSLDEILQKWEGILNIHLNQGKNLKLNENETRLSVEVVNEALLNAYRHGKATEVEVNLARNSSKKLVITVNDNGLGVSSVKPGLGSSLFNSFTKNWSLTNRVDGKGAVFSIEF